MTSEQYAASIVEKYHVEVDTGSPSHRAADEVIPMLKQWGKQYLQGLALSGAYAKNTAVTVSSDVDLLIVLNPVPNADMKRIFWSLFEFLTERDLRPHSHNVSIRLRSREHWVDLIPSYHDSETSGHILFNKRSGTAVHTDVAKHIHLVANSGRQQEICALKIWREHASLDFPSLYLELTTLHALGSERFGQLADNVLTVLRYLANRFEHAEVRDPANSSNIVSNDLTGLEKQTIAKAAREVIYDENWKKILW